jgi:hypothetical protein
MNDLSNLKTSELLKLYNDLLQELIDRKVVRSRNNPAAGIAEYLVIHALGLKRAPLSTKGYNASDNQNHKYEIKGRHLTRQNPSRMLSAIRECELGHFDFLAGVLFNENFTLYKACLVPHKIVLSESKYRKHVNAHILELDDAIWNLEGVTDITKQLRSVPGIF